MPGRRSSRASRRILSCTRVRGHTREFCLTFRWPKVKAFHFSAHSEQGANALAREWCRKRHHYYYIWFESAGHVDFSDAGAFIYAESVEFADWATEVLPASTTTARISELRAARPMK